jgi:hypothetical protein
MSGAQPSAADPAEMFAEFAVSRATRAAAVAGQASFDLFEDLVFFSAEEYYKRKFATSKLERLEAEVRAAYFAVLSEMVDLFGVGGIRNFVCPSTCRICCGLFLPAQDTTSSSRLRISYRQRRNTSSRFVNETGYHGQMYLFACAQALKKDVTAEERMRLMALGRV